MKVIFSRHGNTFGPDDKVVMAGLKNDLPLVQKGGEQAETLAKALIAREIKPDFVICSELQRTRRYAEIVMEKLGLPGEPIVDARLNELDYGEWTGLSDDEINEKFGEESRLNWQQKAEWPESASWGSTPEEVMSDVKSFMADLENMTDEHDIVLAISSGGRLRYFLTLMDGVFEDAIAHGTLKVKTGHVCQLTKHDNGYTVGYWNLNPEKVLTGEAIL